MEFVDYQTFDAYAELYGWQYDNSGNYRDQSWTWYAGPIAHVVLMRQEPDNVALVRFDGLKPIELWSGRVSNTEQFDQLMKTFAEMGGHLE